MYFVRTAMTVCCFVYSAAAQAVGPPPPAGAQKQALTVGYLKVGHLTPMGSVSRLLEKCGVDMRPVEFVRYADARTALLSGSLDVASISPADLAIALAQGADRMVGLTGVASSPKYLVTRKGVDIDQWKDIAGKRIGVAPGSAVWFQWAATLTEKGVPYNSFTPVNIQGGGTAFVQSLQRGDIDAAVLWEPFESQLVSENGAYFAKNLEYSRSGAVGAELGLLAATRDAVQHKRDAVKCLLWAYKSEEERLAKDPEAFAQEYAKFTSLPLPITRASVKLIRLGGVIDADQLKRQAKTFHQLGVVPKDVSGQIDKAWDPTLVREVQ